MSTIYLFCKCQLKCLRNQDELTYNIGYFYVLININYLKKISSNANINVANFHHVIIQLNIWKILHIMQAIYSIYKSGSKTVDNYQICSHICWKYYLIAFLREVVFSSWKDNIKYWLLITPLINSMNGLYIQNLLTKMLAMFLGCKCQLKFC